MHTWKHWINNLFDSADLYIYRSLHKLPSNDANDTFDWQVSQRKSHDWFNRESRGQILTEGLRSGDYNSFQISVPRSF